MIHCVNIKHPDVLDLSKALGLPKIVVASKIAIWQESNTFDRFPTVEELYNANKNQAISLNNDTKELYKNYNLLNDKGEIKIVPDNDKTRKWVRTLNMSPNYSFQLKNTPSGLRILIYPKKPLNPQTTLFSQSKELNNNIQGKQFQNLTAEEKAKTIEQVTKEHRSITALKDLSAKLAHRIGGKVEFENKTDADWKGYNQGMTSVLNEVYMTPDTPFHEILGHPIIRAIKNQTISEYTVGPYEGGESLATFKTRSEAAIFIDNHPNGDMLGISTPNTKQTELYQNLLKELETGRGKEVFEQVKRDYVTKEKPKSKNYNLIDSKNNSEIEIIQNFGNYWFKEYNETLNRGNQFNTNEELESLIKKEQNKHILNKYTLEEQQEEAIVTLLGLMAADKLDAKKDANLISKLKELWKQISDFVKSLLRQDGIKIDELPITTTLNDLAEIMAYGNNKIILPGYKVEYSTPSGNKYDTLEEVNQEIRGLADANAEVDLSGVSLGKKLKTVEDIPVDSFIFEDPEGGKYLYNKVNNKWVTKEEGTSEVFDIKDEIVLKAYKNYINYNTQGTIETFIEKNKEYEQAKEIIEQWKKENNIQYDPEEVYSRGQGFYSSIGAYSNLELDLLLKNLIQHIQDNKKAGGEFTISAFTKPIDSRLKHIEGTGDRVRFVIYPQSEHIKWAAPTDVHSGSVWDAHEKVSKDKKSELLGVSFTKAPSLKNINEVSPNLAEIIDNLSHAHNEAGLELTLSNFEIEYDENIDYSTKQIINSVNRLLQQKRLQEIDNFINTLEKECK